MRNIGLSTLYIFFNIYVRGASVKVTDLTAQTFNQFLVDNPSSLVMFHATWCGYCQKLSPEFDSAYNEVLAQKVPVNFAKVDGSLEEGLRATYDIHGYPTLLFFKDGKKFDYTGGRDAGEIISWVKARTESPVKKVSSMEECESNSIGKGVFMMKGSKNDEYNKLFEKIADENRESGVFCVSADDLNEIHVKHVDEPLYTIKVDESNDVLKLNDEVLPLFSKISKTNFRDYYQKPFALGWVCDLEKSFDRLAVSYRAVARKFKGKIAFVLLDMTQYNNYAANVLMIDGGQGLVIEHESKYYHMPDQDSFDNESSIEAFAQDFVDNKVAHKMRSEPVPQEQSGKILKVVGHSFEREVLQSDKDMLLKVHAVWCTHCRDFASVYQEVADEVSTKYQDVVVAEIDSSLNDMPQGWEYNEVPTLLYIPKNTKVPTRYEGDRSLADVLSFVENSKGAPAVDSGVEDFEL